MQSKTPTDHFTPCEFQKIADGRLLTANGKVDVILSIMHSGYMRCAEPFWEKNAIF